MALGVVAAWALWSAACGEAASTPSAPGYVQLHEALLERSCASASCHGGPIAMVDLRFEDPEETFAHLIDGEPVSAAAREAGLRLVVPGDPSRSLLYRKLADSAETLAAEGLGDPMPLAQPPVGDDAVDAVRAWIEAGAPYEGAPVTIAQATAPGDDAHYVACEATDEAGLRACLGEAPDTPDNLRLYTPPMTIPAGTEQVICSFLEVNETALRIKAASSVQMSGGHHAAVFVGLMAPGDRSSLPCSEVEMGSLRFIAGAGGAGAQDTVLPDGTALTIAAGQRVVIQSHYINMTPTDRVVMDAVDLQVTTLEESPTDVDAFAVVDSDLDIPVGAENFERVKTCTVNEPMDILMMLGHTHDYGVLFTLEFVREGVADLLYQATHGPTLRDTPDVLFFDDPLRLEPGDKVRMTCAWTNTSDHALGWPEEMCVGLMYYSPGRGYLICDTDDPSPVVQGGEAVDPEGACVVPGDEGNELGIGRYCTAEGGECDDTPEPTLCLAALQPGAPEYCSVILCQDDSACGEGATCVFEGAGSACVPLVCQD